MNHLAVQQFLPEEHQESGCCIWCGGKKPKNRAHIISRKLSDNASRSPVLRFSVCHDCNSACGELEKWVLRYTPLTWIRFMMYLGANRLGDTKDVPSYFFSQNLGEWIVFHLDANRQTYMISTQLLINRKGAISLLTQSDQTIHGKELNQMITMVRCSDFIVDERASMPKDFSPRLILEGGQTILICRNRSDIKLVVNSVLSLDKKPKTVRRMQLENTGQERYHFKWSRLNWARFCSKTAYEALCLFEGGSVCLSPSYKTIRQFVREGLTKTGREVIFSEKGPIRDIDTPKPIYIDLTVGQNAPVPIPALMAHCEPGMHYIVLYEINGWILSSVTFAGFPPSVVVMGGPNTHLKDLYQLIYDDIDKAYDFVRLAYDKSRPVFTIPVEGELFNSLRLTYNLRSFKIT